MSLCRALESASCFCWFLCSRSCSASFCSAATPASSSDTLRRHTHTHTRSRRCHATGKCTWARTHTASRSLFPGGETCVCSFTLMDYFKPPWTADSSLSLDVKDAVINGFSRYKLCPEEILSDGKIHFHFSEALASRTFLRCVHTKSVAICCVAQNACVYSLDHLPSSRHKLPDARRGAGLNSVSRLRKDRYHLLHPPESLTTSSASYLLWTSHTRLNIQRPRVWFITLIYIYIYS